LERRGNSYGFGSGKFSSYLICKSTGSQNASTTDYR
jgi:hypothetical protein